MMTKPVVIRFWEKVSKKESDECWNWSGFIHPTGYGMLNVGFHGITKMIGAHRVSWELHFGLIPDEMFVCHHCDNRACVNPDHLFLGTHQDNIDDRERKGRNKIPNNRGENHGNHKLSIADVIKIRDLGSSSNYTQQEIANMFGVNRRHISRIILRKEWGWLS